MARLELLNARYQHAELDVRLGQAKRAIFSALDDVSEEGRDRTLPPPLTPHTAPQLTAQFEENSHIAGNEHTVKLLRKYSAERRAQQRR